MNEKYLAPIAQVVTPSKKIAKEVHLIPANTIQPKKQWGHHLLRHLKDSNNHHHNCKHHNTIPIFFTKNKIPKVYNSQKQKRQCNDKRTLSLHQKQNKNHKTQNTKQITNSFLFSLIFSLLCCNGVVAVFLSITFK